MRAISVLAVLLLSGCATGIDRPVPAGQEKNAGPVRYARLGVMTRDDEPNASRCGMKQVNWCTDPRGGDSCRCYHVHEAEHMIRRLVGRDRIR